MLVPETDAERKRVLNEDSTRDPQDLSDEEKLDLIRSALLDQSMTANGKCAFMRSLMPTAPPVTVIQAERALCWEVWQKTDGHCSYCGVRLNPFERAAVDGFTIDHVIPSARGGSDELDNLVPACRRCNCNKGKLTPEEWRGSHV